MGRIEGYIYCISTGEYSSYGEELYWLPEKLPPGELLKQAMLFEAEIEAEVAEIAATIGPETTNWTNIDNWYAWDSKRGKYVESRGYPLLKDVEDRLKDWLEDHGAQIVSYQQHIHQAYNHYVWEDYLVGDENVE